MVIFLRSASDHPSTRPSKPFAGVGVANRRSEEAKAEGQHNDVQHGILLTVPARIRNLAQKRTAWLRQIKPYERKTR
jgi:hypothetical protein